MNHSTNASRTGSAQDNAPDVVVAIVNYCTADLVIDCLRSLAPVRDECSHLAAVVADNASPDGSGKQIADAIVENGWSEWAKLLEMPRNGGFSYGNNGVIREYLESQSPPEFFWLLNSDTVVRKSALTALLSFMRDNPNAGIGGSRLEDPDGTPQHSAFRFHSIAAEFEGSVNLGVVSKILGNRRVAPPIVDVNQRFDWLSGASMLIRTEVLQQAGLFDEAYFLYFEETDFCLRAQKHGWQCWYVPESRVVHLVGKSTGVTERTGPPKRRPSYWFESRRRYFVKHNGRVYGALADLALASGTILWMARAGIQRRPAACPEKFLVDLARHSAAFNGAEAGA